MGRTYSRCEGEVCVCFDPVSGDQRIANLDLLRGVAVHGAFFVSAIAYGLPHAAFFNLKSPGTNNWLDWVVAVTGELLFDQRAVVMLAMLYGAGVARLARRAAEAGVRPIWPALRRTALLFGVGVPVGFHGLLWEGTPLWLLAFFTPIPFHLRHRSTRTLWALGILAIALSALMALEFHPVTEEERATLGQYWVTGAHELNDVAGGFMALGTFSLLAGAMILGVVVDRMGLFELDPSGQQLQRMIRWGLGLGLPLALATMVWRFVGDYSPDVAILAEAPNTVAALPLTLGYVGLITKWGAGSRGAWLKARVCCVGRMALTNTIATTVFGIFVLRDYGFGRGYFSRSELLVVVAMVWGTQLIGSWWWLQRFAYGPFEWLLRVVTYWRRVDFRHLPGSV